VASLGKRRFAACYPAYTWKSILLSIFTSSRLAQDIPYSHSSSAMFIRDFSRFRELIRTRFTVKPYRGVAVVAAIRQRVGVPCRETPHALSSESRPSIFGG